MAKGTGGCGRHGDLFGGSCLGCISSGRASSHHARHGDYAGSFPSAHRMTAAERHGLPRTAFALRKRNPPALPLRDIRPGKERDYIKAASGRLMMMKNLGHLRPGEWEEGARNIAAAAKRVGVHSHLLER